MGTTGDNDKRKSRVVGIVDLATGRAVVDGPSGSVPTMLFAAGIASALGRLSRPVETGATTYEHTVDLTGEGE